MDKVDRKGNWEVFTKHMVEYLEKPIKKYGQEMDLMTVTPKEICIWNILKYAFRLWYGHGKEYDYEKITHYAQMAWTMRNTKRTKEDKEYKG